MRIRCGWAVGRAVFPGVAVLSHMRKRRLRGGIAVLRRRLDAALEPHSSAPLLINNVRDVATKGERRQSLRSQSSSTRSPTGLVDAPQTAGHRDRRRIRPWNSFAHGILASRGWAAAADDARICAELVTGAGTVRHFRYPACGRERAAGGHAERFWGRRYDVVRGRGLGPG